MSYHQLNDRGRLMIYLAICEHANAKTKECWHHEDGRARLAWWNQAEAVADNAAPGDSWIMEIGRQYTFYGEPATVHLTEADFDLIEIEAEATAPCGAERSA